MAWPGLDRCSFCMLHLHQLQTPLAAPPHGVPAFGNLRCCQAFSNHSRRKLISPRCLSCSAQGVNVDFNFEVFMHSTLAEPLCCAIVELILVERQEDGVVEGEYSAGWAQASRPHKRCSTTRFCMSKA